MGNLLRAAAIISVLLSAPAARAASFDISPINIFFDAAVATEKLTIRNTGDADLSLQLRLYEWSQDGTGQDVYTETKDLVAFPKIVTIKKGEERIIRIGTQVKPAERERTYRVYLEEVPLDAAPRKGTAIRFLSRVGVPVFLKPHEIAARISMQPLGMKGGKLGITLKNEGNYHAVITGIAVRGRDRGNKVLLERELKGWYLLSGAARTYTAEIARDLCAGLVRIEVEAALDAGQPLTGTLDVTREMCQP